MRYTSFGASNRRVSRLGLGLAALGRPGYITLNHAQDLDHNYDVAAMQAHTHAVLDLAWDAGIRYFDAARSYGRAEEFLGNWLQSRQIPTTGGDAAVVGSKWGYRYTAEWRVDVDKHEIKDHTFAMLQGQWRETETHLGQALSLYQIHSATFDSGVLNRTDVLLELARLKEQGILIGITLSGAGQSDVLAAALEIEVNGVALFDAVQATWNLLEPSAGPVLAQASQAGLGVIVKEALANGRLTGRNQNAAFAGRHRLLQRIAARHHTGIDAIALAATLAQPWAHVILSGAAAPDQLRDNLQALTVQLDDADWETLGALRETPEAYWQTRSDLAWN